MWKIIKNNSKINKVKRQECKEWACGAENKYKDLKKAHDKIKREYGIEKLSLRSVKRSIRDEIT